MYSGHKCRSIGLLTHSAVSTVYLFDDSGIPRSHHRQPISIAGIEKDSGRVSLHEIWRTPGNNAGCFTAIYSQQRRIDHICNTSVRLQRANKPTEAIHVKYTSDRVRGRPSSLSNFHRVTFLASIKTRNCPPTLKEVLTDLASTSGSLGKR